MDKAIAYTLAINVYDASIYPIVLITITMLIMKININL